MTRHISMIVASIDEQKLCVEKNALLVLHATFLQFHVQLHRYYIYNNSVLCHGMNTNY